MGYKAAYVGDFGLCGRSDEEICAFAWRKGYMVITHDADFLDDKRFPEHRNPGIIVVGGGSGSPGVQATAILHAAQIYEYGAPWHGVKALVSGAGEVRARHRDANSGKIVENHCRFTNRKHPEHWIGE